MRLQKPANESTLVRRATANSHRLLAYEAVGLRESDFRAVLALATDQEIVNAYGRQK